MSTLSRGGTSIVPALVMGYETRQEAATLVHEVIGRGTPDVSLAPARSRSGALRFFFLDEADMEAARVFHAAPGPIRLENTDQPTQSFTYVVVGDIRTELDPATLVRWTLEVEYREVAP